MCIYKYSIYIDWSWKKRRVGKEEEIELRMKKKKMELKLELKEIWRVKYENVIEETKKTIRRIIEKKLKKS